MMSPQEAFKELQDRNKALEVALEGCLREMQLKEIGQSLSEGWGMAMELASKVLKGRQVV